jgi:uncharacterized membrane protein YccC
MSGPSADEPSDPVPAVPAAAGVGGRITGGLRQALMTAGAAWISYVSTNRLGLDEGYWAAISAIVVMQANLDETRHSALDRFIGTAIGGVIAWACALGWDGHVWIYAAAVGVTVFCCWIAGVSNAGRLAAVAVTVIVLIPRDEPIWKVAFFRFLEVSWGIAVAVGMVAFVDCVSRRMRSVR